MPPTFQDRKAKILADLNTPDEDYQDLSPKGSVDAGIRDLISEINASPDYVTTSSCAGRIAVYLEGSKGAKAGGKWLFTSHDPVELPGGDGKVFELFGLQARRSETPPDTVTARFVHFKYEPMVGRQHFLLHSLTSPMYIPNSLSRSSTSSLPPYHQPNAPRLLHCPQASAKAASMGFWTQAGQGLRLLLRPQS